MPDKASQEGQQLIAACNLNSHSCQGRNSYVYDSQRGTSNLRCVYMLLGWVETDMLAVKTACGLPHVNSRTLAFIIDHTQGDTLMDDP